MPRLARVVIAACPHHLTQRGNRREDVFFAAADRVRYLELLAEYAEKHGLAVQAYCLMTNPVRAGMVEWAEGYRWSSAAAHCGQGADGVLSDPCELTSKLTPDRWRQWLRDPWEAEDEMIARLRQCTHTGRPAGGTDFIARLEALVGRVLRARKVGRPRKHRKASIETTESQSHAIE